MPWSWTFFFPPQNTHTHTQKQQTTTINVLNKLIMVFRTSLKKKDWAKYFDLELSFSDYVSFWLNISAVEKYYEYWYWLG